MNAMTREKIMSEVLHGKKEHPEYKEIDMFYYMFGVIDMMTEMTGGKDKTPFTDVVREISKAYGYDLDK